MKAAKDGYFILKVGDETIIEIFNVDLSVHDNKLQFIEFQAGKIGTDEMDVYLDDIYIINDIGDSLNDFLGVCGIIGVLPTSDTGINEFDTVPNSANHVNCINKLHYNPNIYLSCSHPNKKELFKFKIPEIYGEIKALNLSQYVSGSEFGSDINFKHLVGIIDGTELTQIYESIEYSVSDGNLKQFIFGINKNPFTQKLLTVEDLNKMVFGIKISDNQNEDNTDG